MSENKLKMFQYSLLWHPNETEAEEGKTTKILIEPTPILAENKDDASVKAFEKIPDAFKFGNIELLIN